MTDTDKITVYYDGACPLCQREISFYRRRRGADSVRWMDLSRMEAETVAPGLSRSEALRRFHIRRPDGKLVSGVTAFADLWMALPGFRRFGRVLRYRPLVRVLDYCYDVFLRIRPFLQALARPDPTGGRRDRP